MRGRLAGWSSAMRHIVAVIVFSLAGVATLPAQTPDATVPFEAGERIAYRVRIPIFGTVGRAVFAVDGPVEYRGEDVLLLSSSVTTKWGPIRGHSESASWFDPDRLLALRFEKEERQPGYHDSEDVTLFPASGHFEAANGARSEMPTDAPLDELSFIYFLRTLELSPDSVIRFRRHYDPARNPVSVRLIGRESIETGIGRDDAWIVEMRVRHPRHYRGEGVIRIHISADPRRIPLRIESTAPATGKVTLELDSYTAPSGSALAIGR